ncbi:MAG: MFS transporter [Anaerolineae bacterium]|nr:MFS transporter [Anaerolineae bacterium]
MYHRKWLRYATFGSLYFAQGTVFSYFTALNALYLLANGLTMTDVGIFAFIAMIPFMLKIFLGMLSDRVNLFGLGHRKPYIVIGLLVQFACLLVAPFINPGTQYGLFVGMAFVLQMGMALYDTCTDGLALDTTPEAEQGTVQGIMSGGRALGMVLVASAVGLLAQNVGWQAVFWLLAGLTLIPLLLVLPAQEPGQAAGRAFQWEAFRAFRARNVIALAGLGFVLYFVITGVNQLVNPFLEQTFGISLATAGLVTTVLGIGMVIGSLTGGALVTRIGRRGSVWAGMGISSLAVLALALTTTPALAWPLVMLFGLAYGLYQTVYFALSMAHTDMRIAATMFAILMAITNVADGAGMAFSGVLADTVGFRLAFVIMAALNLLAVPLIPAIFGRRAAAVAGQAG